MTTRGAPGIQDLSRSAIVDFGTNDRLARFRVRQDGITLFGPETGITIGFRPSSYSSQFLLATRHFGLQKPVG